MAGYPTSSRIIIPVSGRVSGIQPSTKTTNIQLFLYLVRLYTCLSKSGKQSIFQAPFYYKALKVFQQKCDNVAVFLSYGLLKKYYSKIAKIYPKRKRKLGKNTLVPNVYIFVPAVSIFHTKLYLLHRDDAFVIKIQADAARGVLSGGGGGYYHPRGFYLKKVFLVKQILIYLKPT